MAGLAALLESMAGSAALLFKELIIAVGSPAQVLVTNSFDD